MLRISITEAAEDSATLRLEGQITGEWTAALGDACERALAAGRQVTLDLADVSLIDRPGLTLLAALSRRAVSFARCSPFQQEQLRLAAASQPDGIPLATP